MPAAASPLLTRLLGGLGLAALLEALWLPSQVRGVDMDFFWHLQAGLQMLRGHAPYATDEFSWTVPGQPWVDTEWLSQLLYAGAFSSGQFPGTALLHVGVLAVVTLVLVLVARRARVSWGLAALLGAAVQLQLLTLWWPRMQVFTVLGLALTALVLVSWREGRWWPGMPYLFAAWMVLWANLHGGAIIGPGILLVVLGAEALASRWSPAPRPLAPLALTAGLGALATLLNPHGVGLWTSTLAVALDPTVRQMNAMIAEWQGLDLRQACYQLAALWLLVPVVATVLVRRRPPLAYLLFAAFFLTMGASAQRHVWLALVATLPWTAWTLARAGEDGSLWGPRRRLGLFGLTGLVLGVLLLGPLEAVVRHGPFKASDRYASMGAVQALVQDPPRHLFNQYEWGGELILLAYPKVKVFIDGRQYLYGLELNRAHDRLILAAPGHAEELAARAIDGVFVAPDMPLAQVLDASASWQLRYRDASAAYYRRR